MNARPEDLMEVLVTGDQLLIGAADLRVTRKLETRQGVNSLIDPVDVPLDADLLRIARQVPDGPRGSLYKGYVTALETYFLVQGSITIAGAMDHKIHLSTKMARSPRVYRDSIYCRSVEEACDLFPADADTLRAKVQHEADCQKAVHSLLKYEVPFASPVHWMLFNEEPDVVVLSPGYKQAHASKPDGLTRLGQIFPGTYILPSKPATP